MTIFEAVIFDVGGGLTTSPAPVMAEAAITVGIDLQALVGLGEVGLGEVARRPRPICSDECMGIGFNQPLGPTSAPGTVIDRETDTVDQLDPGQHAHIVVKPGENAAAAVLEARIMGTPLTALCGHVFVPQRDPQKLPVCPKCKEIYDLMRMMNENLHETPRT